jgi:hypothetical protein
MSSFSLRTMDQNPLLENPLLKKVEQNGDRKRNCKSCAK